MHDGDMVNPTEENKDEVKGIKIVPEKRKANPLNKILICLIAILVVLLALQISSMNNVEDIIPDDTIPAITTPDIVELTPELFNSDSILLDFADITLSIENPSIRDYFHELTGNMDNFTPVYDLTILPSENIFEIRFKDAATCIYFYDRVNGDQSYCSIMHQGELIGTYLVPATYYGSMYNIVYTADGVTQHTKDIISKQLADIAASAAEFAVVLNDTHIATDKSNQIKVFESKVKAKETGSIVYSLNGEKLLICCYMNLRYYVYLTEMDGTVIQENVYNHYSLLNAGVINFYNETPPVSEENFVMNDTSLLLRVG